MLYTLAHARSFVSPFVESGTCPNKQVVLDRINEACRRLMDEGDWRCTLARFRFVTNNNTITLPRNAEAVLHVDIDTVPRKVFGQSYEFLESGPGELDVQDGYGSDLMDLGGGWPTFFEMPYDDDNAVIPSTLIALSTKTEDVGQLITIRGFTSLNNEVFTGATPGEQLRIGHWQNGVEGVLNANDLPDRSVNTFIQITAVQKPVTRGYISLYTYDSSDHRMYFLGKYHPEETNPGYRRYRLASPDFDNARNVLCLVKLRHVELVHDTDVLPIQSLDALKAMVIAIREENAGNDTKAEASRVKAIRILERQLRNSRESPSEGEGLQVISEFALGSAPNLQ